MVVIDAALDKYSLPYVFIIYAGSVQTASLVINESIICMFWRLVSVV